MRDTLLNKTGAIISAGPAQTDLDDPADGLSDAEPEIEWRELLAGAAQHGQRLDRALADGLPEFSRSYLQQLIEDGAVTVNGRPQHKVSTRLKAGDACRIGLRPTPQSRAFIPQAMDLAIVFADAHLLVIDKPAGLVVHPAPGHWSGTLLNGLLAFDAAMADLPRAGIVHRLDKDTSGLMLVARTRVTMEALVRMIAARTVRRQYLALAHRPWSGPALRELRSVIGRDPGNRLRMAEVDPARHAGKPAHTTVERIDSNAQACLVRCTLHTGRTHQIRVHAAWLGQPLVADVLYGGRSDLGLARQALHAHRLSLAHPVTGDALCFDCPPPTDLLTAIAAADLQYNGATWWQALAS
jgi:23S rRNA pseudouridine1911/1915/1917 synthase